MKNKYLKRIYLKILHYHDKKKERICDSNSKEIYYIIRFNRKEGLLSMFFKTMAYVEFAEKNGYIPIIDMKNYPTMYTQNDNNGWENFFSQPNNLDIDLKEIYTNKNYIVSGFEDNSSVFINSSLFGGYFSENYSNNVQKKVFIESHFMLNSEINKMIGKEMKQIDIKNKLGVFIRGTDCTSLKPKGHPIQPSFDLLKNKIDDFIFKYKEINGIYLVTEDLKLYQQFKKIYGDFITMSYEDNLIEYKEGKLLYSTLKNKDRVLQGREYLVRIILLSKCRYLITSITNGSVCALAFNGDQYKDRYIFNLGMY